jgi:hypothetical protein
MNSDKGGEFPDEALPALLVYQNSQLLHNLLPLSDYLVKPFTQAGIEKLLKSHELLPRS